jgi:tetratricopeptide (TPR) repeat protein
LKKSLVYKILLIAILLNCTLYAKNQLIESQPEIIFQFQKLKKSQENLSLQVDFNKAVLLLSKNKYDESIKIFKSTARILPVPSNLNIGIAFYKLNSIDNAIVYLNKVYANTINATDNTFSYMSACYYLYQISKDNKYLDKIIKISRKFKKLSEHSKRMLADTYIILKDYTKALKVLNSMDYALNLKKALLNIKLKKYKKANKLLEVSKEETVNPNTFDKVLWFSTFTNLKLNNLDQLKENLELIKKRKSTFKTNLELPLEIYFNKSKYTPKQYLDGLVNFDNTRKFDFLYYFAPFVFSDTKEVIYDSAKGFLFDSSDNIDRLTEMVDYNAKFLTIVKDDPIIRVVKLKKLLKSDTKSYVYYNLALSYAQINDFHNAYKYFEKAYKLNPGNKLYSVMSLITAKALKLRVKDKDYLEKNIKTNDGLYNDFGKELYKLFINEGYSYTVKNTSLYQNTIFFKAIDYMKQLNAGTATIEHALLDKYFKDPLTYLMRLVYRKQNESDFSYYSRLQDNIPLRLNNNFLDGPLIVTKYYIDLLKAVGLLSKADFKMPRKNTPSYLRTKALKHLHFNESDETVKILEYLQYEYNIEDKYSMYLMVAALLESGRYNDASLQISLIKAILNDSGADFLTAVQLIQELKLSSAMQYIKEPYIDSLIDFKLIGFDKYLESL